MEQLLKQTKSRFSHGGQPTPITEAVQSCGVEEGTALYTWQQVLVKGGLLTFRVSLTLSSWSLKLGNTEGISENQIIC